jgi:hypothetical protein
VDLSGTSSTRLLTFALIGLGALGIVILTIGWVKLPERHNDLWFELAKSGLNLVVVTIIGTAISLLVKKAEERRASLRRRDEVRVQVLNDIITCYNQVKSVRRNLRALGLRDLKTPLTGDQVKGLQLQLSRLNDAQLMFEALNRGTNETRPFDAIANIHSKLEQVEQYLNEGVGRPYPPGSGDPKRGGVLKEWEVRSGRLTAGTMPDLAFLQAFLGPQSGGFEQYLSTPLDNIIDTARKELLGSR